ncbi:transposase [Xanthovirga aplysinae]|uniref:transposase n=1 Tax=Xanthovirga aplysinae TaxID=2529853 RepID=UPI003CCD2063
MKLTPQANEAKGFDGNKKVNGRKRHYITDTLGLLMEVVIGSANETYSKWYTHLQKMIFALWPLRSKEPCQ